MLGAVLGGGAGEMLCEESYKGVCNTRTESARNSCRQFLLRVFFDPIPWPVHAVLAVFIFVAGKECAGYIILVIFEYNYPQYLYPNYPDILFLLFSVSKHLIHYPIPNNDLLSFNSCNIT